VAKYGSFQYSEEVYGTGDPTEYLKWRFQVYWNDAFVEEVTYMTDLQVDRGRDHLLAGGGSGWQRYKAGEAVGTFDNTDGRYDPYNTSSPLYGYLLPGRVVRISAYLLEPYTEDVASVEYPVMRGIIDDIQTFTRQGKRQARIVVKDGLEWLAKRGAELGVTEDAEVLDTVSALAVALGYEEVDDWTVSILGTDSVVVPYAFGNNENAISLINELVDAEAGQIFQANDGVLTLVCNDYAEASTTDIDQSEILRDIELKTPWEVVRTKAKISANPLTEGTPAVLWSYGNEGVVATWTATTANNFPTSPYLHKDLNPGLSGELTPPYTLTTDAIFSSEGPVTSPTVDYDFLMGDEDPLDNWVDAATDFPSFIDQTNFEDIGNGLRLNFIWDGGGGWSHLVIPWVEITATPIESLDSVIATAEDASAILTYGEKRFVLDNTFIQDQGYAQQYADWVVEQLKDAKLFPTIQIEARPELQFPMDLYIDKIHLTVAELGIDDTFRIGKISHRWIGPNGLHSRTTFKLEPVLGAL
jgi:hypothetical protein